MHAEEEGCCAALRSKTPRSRTAKKYLFYMSTETMRDRRACLTWHQYPAAPPLPRVPGRSPVHASNFPKLSP